MAVQFKSSGTLYQSGSSDTATPGAPEGVNPGDLLFLFIHHDGTNAPDSGTSGWTLDANQDYHYNSNAGTTERYRRIADGTSTDTPTIGFAAAQADLIGHIICFTGHDPDNPVQSIANEVYRNNSAIYTLSIPALSAEADGSMFHCYGGSYLGYGGPQSVDNGGTLETTYDSSRAMCSVYKAVDFGNTGTFTLSSPNFLFRWGVLCIIIRPAPPKTVTSSGTNRIGGVIRSSGVQRWIGGR